MDFSIKARAFLRSQIAEWGLAFNNYKGLESVIVKNFTIDGFQIKVQFNPARIVSSAAKVDPQSIEKRPCFLCAENRPEQQRGFSVVPDFTVLVNPFPIFPEHLTIVSVSHTDQRIAGNFETMLDLSESLTDFVLFYNGPKCGASAPDHLHFQAGNRGFLPIEKDFLNEEYCQSVRKIESVTISHWPNYQRGIITLNGKNKHELIDQFQRIYTKLQAAQPNEVEPMLNILTTHELGEWVIHIFPRVLHRPTQYFETGEKQILLSPASVDMGGVLITPRESDFNKISADDIKDIFQQVCLDTHSVLAIIKEL